MAQESIVVNSSVAEISKNVISQLMAAGIINTPKQKRKRIDWERNLINEYVFKFYRDVPHWIREGIGPLPEGADSMFYARTRRWADAIIREPENMLILEGKMRAEPSVVGQLLNYKNLLPQTPMLTKYKELPVKMRVVTAMITDEVHGLLENAGIDVEVFKPSNYDDWYNKVVLKIKDEKA